MGINAFPLTTSAIQTNPGDQLERWLMYRGMRACLQDPDWSPNTDFDDNGDVDAPELNRGDILPDVYGDGEDNAGGGGTKEGFGYLGPDMDGANGNDGTVGCANGEIFMRGATLFGFDNVVSLVCAMNRGMTALGAGGRIQPDNGTDCEKSTKFHFDGGGGDIFQRALTWALTNEGDKDRPAFNINDNNGADYSHGAMLYLIGKRSLEVFCGLGDSLESASVDNDKYKDDDDVVSVDVVNADGTIEKSQSYPIADPDRDENSMVNDVYYNQGGNSNEAKDLHCYEMAAMTRDNSAAYASWLQKNPDADPNAGGVTEAPDGAGIGADCAGFNFKEILSLNWVLCPLIQGMMSTANALENQITGMLCINETDIFAGADMTCEGTAGSSNSQKAFHDAWDVFRIFALGLLAIAGLLMILSQGLGFEIFDAYTIKKTLPRILVAAIAISLSWPLLEGLVTFSNVLGIGIRSLIYQPFIQAGIDDVVLKGGEAAISTVLGIGGAAVAFVSLGAIGVLSFIGTALLAILLAFFVLVIRNILVILLVLIAPVAIAMYILPNTEKWAKMWWDWLFKALLAFPIITAMIAIGHVFAAITSQKGGGLLTTVVAFIAYFAPYFLIPAAFRFAGGALATIGGFANDRSRGGFDRLKQLRKNQVAKNWQDVKTGNRYKGGNETNWRGKVNRGLAGAANTPEALLNSGALARPTRWRGAVRSAMQNNTLSEIEKNLQENHAYQGWKFNDDLNKAASRTNNAGELRDYLVSEMGYEAGSRDLEDTINKIETVRRSMSTGAFKAMTTRQAIAGGTAHKSSKEPGAVKTAAGEVMADIARASVDDDALAGNLVANARSEGMKAGRIDYAGAGFGTTIGVVQKLRKELRDTGTISQASIEAATREIHADVYKSQGGASLVHSSMKPDAVTEMAPEMISDVEIARRTGATQQEQDRNFTQSLASLAAVYDGMQGSSPAKAKIMADEVFSKTLDVSTLSPEMKSRLEPALRQVDANGNVSTRYSGTITYQQAIDAMRGNNEFKEMRREYTNEVDRQLAGTRAQGQEPGALPPPPGQL
jgi:hypothetical protein